MGRGAYEPALKAGITSPYAHLKQYVFSRTLAPGTDPEVEFATDPPTEVVRRLERRDGRDITRPFDSGVVLPRYRPA